VSMEILESHECFSYSLLLADMPSLLNGLIFQGLLHTSSKLAPALLTLVTMVGFVCIPGYWGCSQGTSSACWAACLLRLAGIIMTPSRYIYFHSLVICVEVTQRVLLRNLGSWVWIWYVMISSLVSHL
jgi:hypothetical protein